MGYTRQLQLEATCEVLVLTLSFLNIDVCMQLQYTFKSFIKPEGNMVEPLSLLKGILGGPF